MSVMYWNFKPFQISICTMYFPDRAVVWIEVLPLTGVIPELLTSFSKPSLYSLAVCTWFLLQWKINLYSKCRSLTDSKQLLSNYLPVFGSIHIGLGSNKVSSAPAEKRMIAATTILDGRDGDFLVLGHIWFVPNSLLCFRWIDSTRPWTNQTTKFLQKVWSSLKVSSRGF